MRSLLVCATVLVCSQTALAQAPERVEVVSNGSEADVQALNTSLSELLKRLSLTLNVVSINGAVALPGPRADVLASALVDFRDPADIVVQMNDSQGTLRLSRRVSKTGTSTMQIEIVAHVIQSVAQELNEPQEIARRAVVTSTATPLPPLVPVEVETVHPPEKPTDETVHFDVLGLGGARLWTGTEAAASVGVGGWLTGHIGSLKLGALLTATWNSPVQVSATLFSLNTQAVSLRLLPTLEYAHAGRFHFQAGLGVGTDLYISTLRSAEVPPNRLPPPNLTATPLVTLAALGTVEITPDIGIFWGLTLDADLAPRRFITEVGGNRETIFEPWRFRPAILVGLSFGTSGGRP